MDLEEFKKVYVRDELEISDEYGTIFSFIDFSNVNRWFEYDRQDWNNKQISENEFISIDIYKLKDFADLFSEKSRIYYGEDPKNPGSLSFTYELRRSFGKRRVVTKDIQRIKHYINADEKVDSPHITKDRHGRNYLEIRKCNFDVEISVDAVKMLEHYDTFCLFSGDADFAYLNDFLKKKGKRVIIIKGGHITTQLKQTADLIINAQNIKKHIALVGTKKQRPD